MLHMRIVAPPDCAPHVLELFCAHDSVTNVVHLPNAAKRPEGDVILADVAREDASVIVSDLRELRVPELGSIAIEQIDTEISEVSKQAEKAAAGAISDAVVWEEIEARTSENAELSASFVAFMVLAMLIAAVGIFLDTPILIIGAMIVGPEFGPLAGLCVAVVQRRRSLAWRSALALIVGFPVGITATWLCTVIFRLTGATPDTFTTAHHSIANVIASPDFFTVFVAICAGAAGVLSLTAAKSGALIGVLVSVTTIPAAANIGVAFAYQDWSAWRGSMVQLAINLACLVISGVAVLTGQRIAYRRRRVKHLRDPARREAGLPVGHSRRGTRRLTDRQIAELDAEDRRARVS